MVDSFIICEQWSGTQGDIKQRGRRGRGVGVEGVGEGVGGAGGRSGGVGGCRRRDSELVSAGTLGSTVPTGPDSLHVRNDCRLK